MWPSIIAGFGIGLAGSLHCVGMCGPLAMALPMGQGRDQQILNILLYNSGRAITYGLLGLLFGWLGNNFFIAGYQQVLSISVGIGILLLYFINSSKTNLFPFINRFTNAIKNALVTQMKSKSLFKSSLLVGILNGLLPCGMVYLAIGSAMATGSIQNGTLLMFSFGLGTIPLMTLLMIFGKSIKFSWRLQLKKALPIMVVCMSVLLILRGLNLGIPYVSPHLNVEGTTPKMIHCD
jgi:sulfite exporter TauE/SafE